MHEAALARPGVAARPRASFGLKIILIVMALSLTWDAIGDFVYLVRITLWSGVAQLYAVMNAVSIALMVLTVAGGFLYTMLSTRPISTNQAVANLGFFYLLAIGIASALVHHNHFGRPFIGQLYYWVTMFLSLNIGMGVQWSRAASVRVEKLIARASWMIVVFGAVGYLAIEGFRRIYGAELWAGYPAEQFLLPLAHYGRQRRWKMMMLTFALIVITGKRGPLAGAVVILLFVVSRGRVLLAIVPVVLLAIFVANGAVILHDVVESGWIDPESVVGRPLMKWYLMSENVDIDVTQATAGRNIEIGETMKLMESSTEWVMGRGYGWFFFWPSDPDPYHYVHLSYWNYIVTYGLVGAIPMILLIFTGGFRCWRASLHPAADPLLREIVIFMAGFLTVSLSANLLSIYVVFWILFGIGLQLASATPKERW